MRVPTALSVLSLIFLAGCVLGERQPTLHYPPKAEPGVVPAARAATSPAPRSVQIVLKPFADQRSDKRSVGTTRNAFGMKMADVIPTNSVPAWVMQALKTELQKEGYVVLAEGGESPGPASAIVSGEILNVYCDMYFNYTGQVSLVAKVTRAGRDILTKHYSGEGSAGLAWAATEDSYAQSLALALSAALRQFLPDLRNSLAAP